MSDTPNLPRLKPLTDASRIDWVLNAIEALSGDDVFHVMGANELSELSSNTVFDAIEASPDGIFETSDQKQFEAAATVYVTLNYGGRRDSVSMTDTFPATVYGKFENDGASVENIAVDTSSFYGDEAL